MTNPALEKLRTHLKLSSLANVVLLSNRAAESSQSHLEQKIRERLDKEFQDQGAEEEKEIIEGIKAENIRFVNRDIKQQRDGEFFVKIGENVREKDVHLFHKFEDKNLDSMELFCIGDALKRAGVRSISVYLPYMPYQRQDKKDDGRVPISARLFFDLLDKSMGKSLKRIVTMDLHAKQAQGFFDGPVDELSAVPEFAAYYKGLLQEQFSQKSFSEDILVISPDAGGAKRAQYLSRLLSVQYAVLDKKRTGHGKAEHQYNLPHNVKGKAVLLIDDMIDTGSSLVGEYENTIPGPVQFLQERGASVYVCATHRLLSEKNGIAGEERFRSANVPVLFTDSLPEKNAGYYERNKDWMTVISLNYALAKAFFCNQVGESISAFLKGREERLREQKLDYIVRRNDSGLVEVE